MKLKMLSLVALVAFLISCGTYRTTSVTSHQGYIDVPTVIINDFEKQYPSAINPVWGTYDLTTVPIDWELSGWPTMAADDFVVTYDMGNEKYYSWYDVDGEWIGTAMVVRDFTSLPAKITGTLNLEYPGYSITRVDKEFAKDRMAYEVEIKSTDGTKVKLLVDENGTILKRRVKS